MFSTFRIGRILGIDINLHWSWVFIFVLVTWTFATGLLEEVYPGWSDLQRWLAGALASVIFFSSILIHELSHSIVARRYGIPVASITLFVFGGVSSLGREPGSAKQEFWIAIVGPLASFAMAIVFAIGFVVWFWVLSVYPVSNMASFALLTPLFGVLAGWLIFDDQLTPALVVSLSLVGSGIFLINRPGKAGLVIE